MKIAMTSISALIFKLYANVLNFNKVLLQPKYSLIIIVFFEEENDTRLFSEISFN